MAIQGQHSGILNQVLKHASFKKTFASQKKEKEKRKGSMGKGGAHKLHKNSKHLWENKIVIENISLKASNRYMILGKVYSLYTKNE